jgi:hypothetical protein
MSKSLIIGLAIVVTVAATMMASTIILIVYSNEFRL